MIPEAMYTHLSKARETSAERNDFDLLVKVLKVIQKDDYNYQVRVKDISKDAYTMTVSSLRYPILKEGDIIRIRSASVDIESEDNILVLKNHSNILKFIPTAKIIKKMTEDIPEDSEKEKFLQDGGFPRNAVILSEVESKYKDLDISKIADIDFEEDSTKSNP